MESEKIREIIIDQNNYSKKEFIEREIMKDILKSKNTPFIKIVSGIRRCGKSTILKQLKEKFGGVYVNFDDERFVNFAVEDFQKLYGLSLEEFPKNKIFYFDEIQNVSGWERFARRISEEGNNVFITGSNATMLSKDLGTHLTGRYVKFDLYPFSFREYLDFNGIKVSSLTTREKSKIKKQFSNYLSEGGFPEYILTKNKDYLRSLYESILYRDVMARYKLTNEKTLKELIYLSANSISKEVSFNSIKKVLGVGSATTISDYFSYLENTYLLFLLPGYNYSLRKQIQLNKKLYLIDTGLAKQLGFSFSENKGKLLENLVFLELKRRGYELFYFQDKKECDFLVREKNKIVQSVQVSYDLNNENRERELSGIVGAMEKSGLKEGMILTYDEESEIEINKKKIKIKPIWKWLLDF